MEKKINVAELLKDCPKGTELDCTIWDNVTLDYVDDDKNILFPIHLVKKNSSDDSESYFATTKYGQYYSDSKCVIFPKGKTTWEGFVPPCKFKDGDVVVTTLDNIAIIRKPVGKELSYVYGLMVDNYFYEDETAKVFVKRFATEEEKQKLFKAIKDNGYKWNTETKNLEKLIEPKFKVGDRIRRDDGDVIYTINGVYSSMYGVEERDFGISIEDQDNYELVSNKFDINTLVPFDEVLVRDNDAQEWIISLFSHCNGRERYKYSCINGNTCAQCIPYGQNKHLLGKNDDCDNFYKTWEK